MNDAASSELLPEERRFLEIVSPLGLDWRTTRGELETRFGVSRPYNWIDVIALPPKRAISEEPLQFSVQLRKEWSHLPPEYASANFIGEDDSLKNFTRLETQLMKTFGEGIRRDVSNCVERHWRFGVFAVALYAWMIERRDFRSNRLLRENPELQHQALVTLSSDYALVFPDTALEALAGGAIPLIPVDTPGVTALTDASIEFTRRNPRRVIESLAGAAAWRDDTAKRFGVSNTETSVVLPLDISGAALVHRKVEAGRGPGGSSLEVRLGSTGAGVLSHPDIKGLDTLAPSLSKFWGLPCSVETDIDA